MRVSKKGTVIQGQSLLLSKNHRRKQRVAKKEYIHDELLAKVSRLNLLCLE